MYIILFPITQSISAHESFSMLVRSILFYIVINLEAFIFCFAGEYLSGKVGTDANHEICRNAVRADTACSFFRVSEIPLRLSEQIDRRRGIPVALVRLGAQRESDPPVADHEVAEAVDDHDRQVHESLFATVRERKSRISRAVRRSHFTPRACVQLNPFTLIVTSNYKD